MGKTFYYLLKEIRPRQWVKNLIVFFAIFFTGELLNPVAFQKALFAFVIFCFVSSSVYLLNDLVDVEKDKLHPFKKNRPLAAGKLSKFTVVVTAIVLASAGLSMAALLSQTFLVVILFYYGLQFFYSYFLKEISVLDIMAIALSFIVRVIAGEVATGFHMSVWLLLTIISASLFLAIGKRRSELTLLAGWQGAIPAKTRTTLLHYSEKMLDVYISMFANSTWITYAFYTFLQAPPKLRSTIGSIFDTYQLDIFSDRKWMMLTIPFAIYGIMRYLQLVYEKNVGESPEKVLMSDKALILTITILGGLIFTIIYVIGK